MLIAKIPKISYSRNAKLVANLQIGITSLVQQLLTKICFYCMVSWSANPKKTFLITRV